MDLAGAITFGGLVVHGHLKFQDNGIHITTDHVIVQGFLTIGEHANPVSSQIIFTLTGTAEPDVAVVEAVRPDCMGMCGAGIQAFAVIGGVLDLHGMPYDSHNNICPTWLDLKATHATIPQAPADPNPPVASQCGVVFANPSFESPSITPEIPPTCTAVPNGHFEDPSPLPSIPARCGANRFVDGGLESGALGAWVHTGNGELTVVNSTASEGAYSLHVAYPSSRVGQYLANASDCLTAGVQYVFSAKVKLPAGASCYDAAQGYKSCPYSRLQWRDAGGNKQTTSTFGDIEGKWGTDGEWNELYVAVSFTQEQLDSSEFLLYLDVSGNGEFWVDDARLFQPPTPPLGWEIYDDRVGFLQTVTDSTAPEGDSYLLLSRRNSASARAGVYLDARCLSNGVHYLISGWVKLDANHACYSGSSCPRIRLRWKNAEGVKNWLTLASDITLGSAPGDWIQVTGHEVFDAPVEDLEAGSEFFLYVEVTGEEDYAVDDVRIFLPELRPPPHWAVRDESGGFLGIVTDPAGAFDGDKYMKVYGRDGDNADYAFQVVENASACLEAGVEYLVSVHVKLPVGARCYALDDDCPHMQLRTKRVGADSVSRWLSEVDGPEGTDGEWNVLWTLTAFTPEELAADEYFRIEVRVGGSEDYYLDKAEILTAPTPVHPDDLCLDLVRNGGFDWHVGAFAPWYIGGDEKIIAAGGVDGGAYLHNFNRASTGHGPGQHVDVGCVQAGAEYTVAASVMIGAEHSCIVDGSACPRIGLRFKVGGVDKYRSSTLDGATAGLWNAFELKVMFTAEEAAATELYVWVEGGDATQAVGFDAISFTRDALGKNALIVDSAAADGCWQAGDEVVITPSDTRSYHAERKTVTEVTDLGDGTARVTVDSNLEWSHEGSGLWHAEVMLLTRKIKVHGTEAAASPRVAGHFWVKHTAATQTIEGVELHTMGQQGTLGRYPMHLHMCQEMEGTVISALSIHDTFQRCIVIHGTDNATVQSNVAFNTMGHCFFLEDGYEEHTRFLNNIGAQTLNTPASGVISGETDGAASTFWISNPNNVWIGNVAAGSESSGYWFELRDSVRGPSAMLPKAMHYFGEGKRLDPEHHYMGVFQDNRAHSNNGNGLQTYPSRGYNPHYGWANFERFTTFRNRRAGLRFHISDHCRAIDLIAADNRLGVDDDRNTDIEILNASIIGVSDAFRGQAHGVCPDTPTIGIELHAQRSDGERRGTVMDKIAFSGFDPLECAGSAALSIDEEPQPFWDPRHVTSGLTFDAKSRRAYFPLYDQGDVSERYTITDANKQVAIQDRDGSLIGVPGYLVSNNPDIVDSASCALHSYADNLFSNLYTCPGACYRARTLAIPPLATAWPGMSQPQLEISWTDGAGVGKKFLLEGTSSSINDNRNQDGRRHDYYVVLPSAFDVAARFVTAGGQTHTPLFVNTPRAVSRGYADPDPTCVGEFASFSLEVEDRSPCGEMLSNGDVETGTDDFWWVMGMYDGGLSVVDSASAPSGGKILKADGAARTSSWHGAAQYVPGDRMRVGEAYTWSMWIRVPSLGGGATDRVYMNLKLSSVEESSQYVSLKTVDMDTGGWQQLSVDFEWTAAMGAAQSVLMYMSSIDSGRDVHYDAWSVKMAGPCADCTVDAECDDANACTGIETCGLGYCHSGTALTCDDGAWCNGLETCDPDVGCMAGEDPICEGNTPFCNEEADACECAVDADCDTGLFCAPEECVSGVCTAVAHACEGLAATPLCKEETDACVSACAVDGVCDLPYETAESCPEDCTTVQPTCGNGLCEPWGDEPETCKTCPDDCDSAGVDCEEDQPEFTCGNGVAEYGETCFNCPADVAAVEEASVALCNDGTDNDCDGLADGADPDCQGHVHLSLAREGEEVEAGQVQGLSEDTASPAGGAQSQSAGSNKSGSDATSALIAVCALLASLVAIAGLVAVRRAVRYRRSARREAEYKLGVISNELMYDVHNLKPGPGKAQTASDIEQGLGLGAGSERRRSV